jgi:hypothetical protein
MIQPFEIKTEEDLLSIGAQMRYANQYDPGEPMADEDYSHTQEELDKKIDRLDEAVEAAESAGRGAELRENFKMRCIVLDGHMISLGLTLEEDRWHLSMSMTVMHGDPMRVPNELAIPFRSSRL